MTIQDLLKDGYHDGMTIDEINEALADFTIPEDHNAEVENLKRLLSKSNSEAASYKKQLREKMSADEIKAKEDAEKQEKLKNDYDELLKRVRISENKAKLLSLGYDDALAGESAKALAEGDFDRLFENQKKHISAVERQIREQILKETPRPSGGKGREMSKDDIFKIKDTAARQAAIAENMEIFEGE